MHLFLLFILLLLISCALGAYSLIAWLPTKKADLARISRLARLRPGETFFDLGAGDGRVAHYLARANPLSRAVGFEIALPFFLIARLRQFFYRGDNLNIRFKNLFSQNLAEAGVVYVFGIPDKLKNKLKPKLERELTPGARVISYVFAIDGWQPAAIDRAGADSPRIYLYVMP